MAGALDKTIPDDLPGAHRRIRELEANAREVEQVRGLLARSESEYRTAFEHSGTGMVVVREDMVIILVNQRVREIFGFSNEEVRLKKKWTEFVCPGEIERLKKYHTDRRKDPDSAPEEYEFSLRDKDGNVREVLANVAMIPGTTNSLVSMHDITLRKIMERDLRESEQRFKEIAELLPGIICEMDISFNLTYVNKKGLETFGFTGEQYKKGINVGDLILPEDRDRVAKDMHNIFHGDYGNPAEYRLLTKKGAMVHVIINAAPLLTKGSITGMRACIVEITQRVAAEAQLRESEERFRSIFQKSPIGLALFDRHGMLLEMNDVFGNMFYGPVASCGKEGVCVFSLFTLADGEKEYLQKGKWINREAAFPKNARGDDGRWLSWHITPLGLGKDGPSSFLMQVEDITERKKAQEAKLARQREATEKAEALIAGLRHELMEKEQFHSMVSRSPAMREIFRILPEIAGVSASVLIGGESGTGKELIARSLHELSGRSAGPFVAINCAALPDTLLESELFGYRAGAFTDAKKDKPGKFALAGGGTIFFDEIGDISPAMQAKLLRVLQERTYEPLGATAPLSTDVRVVAATNRDLRDMIKKGTFREDLYYRVNVVAIKLPPLRDRRCDIPLLCDYFLERFNARYGKSVKGISQEALDMLLAHDFPGNIRELENAIEHAFVFCKTPMIVPAHLPPALRAALDGMAQGDALAHFKDFDDVERMYISSVLKETNGNKLLAAQRLGIHKATLFRKIKRLGLQRP